MTYRIITGDSAQELKSLPDNSVDSIVTDPPYGLSFMGKKWDYDVPSEDIWRECLRVLKPGGHLLAFAGTRTQHRMAVRIEDAGFEIRDMIAWVYGSGFPKSHDVSKAIAKRAGGELAAKDAISFMRERREELGLSRVEFERLIFGRSDGNVRNWEDGISLPKPGLWNEIKRAMGLEVTPFDADMERGDVVIGVEDGSYGYQKTDARWENKRVVRSPATPEAKQWAGWGSALKPALETITLARKPLIGTIAQNVLQYGTGGLNVDGCRVEALDESYEKNTNRDNVKGHWGNSDGTANVRANSAGRFPANLIHDGSEEVVGLFPESNGGAFPKKSNIPTGRHYDGGWGAVDNKERTEMGNGSASRFYYVAKASKRDRNEGLPEGTTSSHPTVKPTDLMRYLCRLITPPGGTVLDPFTGSGSTGKAAILEGFNFIGIERDPEYVRIAEARISHVTKESPHKSAPKPIITEPKPEKLTKSPQLSLF